MRGVIKGVLAEELQNSLRMQKDYESALSKLPQGCLVQKRIRGHLYWYIVKREGNKVKHLYKGKLSSEEINKYQEAKSLRAQYRHALSKLKKQIKFLKGVLRGKEPI
ncbi:MAG: hypothetical protein KGJ09_03545 [Candidatus Omnitrophica bacterium]|nr:hypothetical protein [Candidatus Omnitrophota bacterium]MDE2214202.1 hypothetical protein [Candidatus Omnitrophota bacterium]MDE2231239.1 hypothetical protein [Candidatus Omnitrophota bacterium]